MITATDLGFLEVASEVRRVDEVVTIDDYM